MKMDVGVDVGKCWVGDVLGLGDFLVGVGGKGGLRVWVRSNCGSKGDF